MLPWQQNFWITRIGSLSNDEGNDNENGKKQQIYTAILRKVVGRNAPSTIPKGNMGYD